MRRWKIYAILALMAAALIGFAYLYGIAITVILIVTILNYIISMRSFKTIKKLIVESQAILAENDKKIYKKIQSVEDRLDG